MNGRSIVFLIFCFSLVGLTSCKKSDNKELIEKNIENEKIILQKNITEVLDKLDFKDKYSISIIYQPNQEHSKNVISEEKITRRVFGKADFSEPNDYPNTFDANKFDGMWEEKNYRANYSEEKETENFINGYFSVIIILQEINKEKKDKIMALMNYSVANSTRGDLINVISKSDFSN